MGGTGKSQVITAFYDYTETVSNFCGREFDEHTIVITALSGSAATELENGCIGTHCIENEAFNFNFSRFFSRFIYFYSIFVGGESFNHVSPTLNFYHK